MRLPRIFQRPEIETKASRAYQTHVRQLPSAVWTPRNYVSFSTEGYSINVVAFQAINRIADSLGSIKWCAYTAQGQKIESHPYLDLLQRPNTQQSGNEFFRSLTAYLYLSGNTYPERVLNAQNQPAELWALRPDRVSIKTGKSGLPSQYTYKVGGNSVTYPVNEVTGDSDLRQIKLFNPLNDLYGQSPMEAAAYAIDQHNEAMRWIQALLQNAAMPSGALTMDKETTLSDDQFQRLRQEIEVSFSGSANAGRPMLLEGGLSWQSLSLTPDDMAIIETKDSAARDISLAFGVPPLLLNIPGDNTYSNYREARLGFYEDTIIPLIDMIASEFNAWLSPYFGGVYVLPDYDKIEAIAEKRRGLWEMVDASDEITVNEAREMKGFGPLPAPIGTMLMADLRASRRGHAGPRSNNGAELSSELAYGSD